MPPKRVGHRASKGYFASVYEGITSPDNAPLVRSLAVFGAAVVFLASPLSEYLLPP
ncbi:putative TOM core complex subunit Tom6 [Durotheca rogersii]|uniref:putative TOM core complex subunit Tom6 n=1 Tax=Durotheca rogersii TaxID=419775 RepID=UPI00221E6C7E|nr:putative TOM core complex subunit Tom6 [Durotheca rogersii]KAI5860859.1 putative TOM core complex subunit Tom6 [Durotheca rogersii]